MINTFWFIFQINLLTLVINAIKIIIVGIIDINHMVTSSVISAEQYTRNIAITTNIQKSS